MKKFTQEEFDAIERDEFGVKHCPTGDYTEVRRFGGWCSFGEECSFGEACSFENIGPAKPGYPFAAWVGAGSREGSKTYFFNLKAGVYVRCECFLGTLVEFRDKVKEKHGADGMDDEYLAVADIVERKFRV